MELIHTALIKYSDSEETVKVFIDGESWSEVEKRDSCLHPIINENSLTFVVNGDKRIPLLNKADHLANMIKNVYSEDEIAARRVLSFKEIYPGIYSRLEQSLVR